MEKDAVWAIRESIEAAQKIMVISFFIDLIFSGLTNVGGRDAMAENSLIPLAGR
jgi:hypothetical protein